MSNKIHFGSLKNTLYWVIVMTAMVMGLYSLAIAFVNTARTPATTSLVMRTAMPSDSGKIEVAVGSQIEFDLVFVIVDNSARGTDSATVLTDAARDAAETVTVFGLEASIRNLNSDHPDFPTIVEQNEIRKFPAVLVVKKGGGIVRITDELTSKALVHTYHSVWGGSTSCTEAKSNIY